MKSIKIDPYTFERMLGDRAFSEGPIKGTEAMILNIFVKALWYSVRYNIKK